MSRHKKFSGRGMYEFYMPTTKKGHINRRDRKKCEYYIHTTKWCSKIFNYCVGPATCKKYNEKYNNQGAESIVGKVVHSKNYGDGVIIAVCDNICTIQYKDIKIQCKKENLNI